jgi:gamma-glutamyltranspeptidase/glutathione hydrolase
MSSFMIDQGLSLEEAFHRPRIDMSGEGRVIADRALPGDVIEELNRFLPTTTARRTIFPYAFAVPAGVLREGELNMGCTEIMSPWGDAVAEEDM